MTVDSARFLLMSLTAMPCDEGFIRSNESNTEPWHFRHHCLVCVGPKKDEINGETCELLLPYLWMQEFTYERAKSACGNVAGLCTWVRAMHTYYHIARFVAPKIEALREAEGKLRIANAKLGEKERELAKVGKEFVSLPH